MSYALRVVGWMLPVALLAGCGDGTSGRRLDGGSTDASGGAGGSAGRDAGGGDAVVINPVSVATSASYEGTYTLDSFTVNPTACDVEGPDETSARDATFVMAGGPAAQPFYLGLAACADVSECETRVSAIRAEDPISADYAIFLDEEVNANLLRGGATYSGRYASGTCIERKWYASELVRTGDQVRMETRTIPLADLPSATMKCEARSPAELTQEAQGRPCSALRVIVGTKTGPLP